MTSSFVISSDQAEHPENTTSDFRVTFNAPIDLEGDYQMCMSRCQTPPILDVIESDFGQIVITNVTERKKPHYINLESKLYVDLLAYTRDINKKMESFGIYFRISKERERVVIIIPAGIRLKISRSIAITLGYVVQGKWFIARNQETQFFFEATNRPRLIYSRKSMFVYCDLVTESFVGNQPRQLLGISFASDNKSRNRVYEPRHLHWYDVKLRHLNSIKFSIRDDRDRKLLLENGTVIITIHLRPKLKLIKFVAVL